MRFGMSDRALSGSWPPGVLGSVRVLLVLAVFIWTTASGSPDPSRSSNAEMPPLRLNEKAYVRIGGIEQWITIKGENRRNPIVLFLHGGPGNAWSPFAESEFGAWEHEFNLVQWDQRGAGRTFVKNGPSIEPTMTLDRMVQDGIEVSEYLVKHLGQRKIFLVGASWGSTLGIYMAEQRPDLFYAYIGVAQVVNVRRSQAESYRQVLERARAAGDQPAVTALENIGPPPWNSIRQWSVFRKVLLFYQAKVVTAASPSMRLEPEYDSASEQAQRSEAADFSFVHFAGMAMDGPLEQIDLTALGPDFAVPIYVIQGKEDLTAPPELAKTYLESITAPRKRFSIVQGTGHESTVPQLELVRDVLREEAGRIQTSLD
jgi:pimeloyl-ACP methyl ester carboxylesterase